MKASSLSHKNWRTICIYTMCILSLVVHPGVVRAASVSTSVTVGNSAPTFTVNPAESPASDGTTPTNVGAAVTFIATATDTNSENYYLAICKTNSVTAVNGGAPTCGGGNWCISTSTTSGAQATCNYTALQADAESNAWFAFACDGNASSAACSASNQGTGSSGSPFKVNHPPIFNAISNTSPVNPGANITWNTNASTLDNDTDTIADTVKLVVCKTTGLAAGDCDGGVSDRWCASSLVANSPSCSYSVPIPTGASSVSAYAYLVDNHNLGATGGNQGSASNYTVSNVAPVVSSVSLNGGSNITLTEGTTTSISMLATITDNNSCTDVSAVEASLYRSGIGYSLCDTGGEANNNNCYPVISCTVVGAGNTCDGSTDASAEYSCTVSVQYFADPTDAGTLFPSETWKNTFKATDAAAATGTAELSTGVEMNSLVGYSVSSAISYGNLAVGQSNDPLDKTTTTTATGNVGLDQELSGTDMTSGPNTITVGNQKYALAASTAYASGSALTTSPVLTQLNCPKTTSVGSPATRSTYWGLSIPLGTVSGSYSGTNTLTATKGDTANW